MKRQIDRFILGPALGSDGSVFQAEEILAGDVRRPVALRVLPALAANDKPGREKFFAELKMLVALTVHPHIAGLYSAGLADEETPWIALELMPQTLAAVIADAPAAPGDVQRLLEHLLAALAFMHTRQPPLLHNDLKPASIALDTYGSFKLSDLSSVGPPDAEPTRGQDSVRFSAPELLSREFGKVCPATDLYALGHVVYEMALGSRHYRAQFPAVFDAKTSNREAPPAKWMQWHCSIPTTLTPIHNVIKTFPSGLSAVIAKLTAKPLDERYAAALDALNDLRNSAAPVPVAQVHHAAAPPGPPIPLAPPPSAAPPSIHRAPIPAPISAPAAATPAPVTPPAGSNVHYYVRLRGRITGPFDMATLQRQARQGTLSRFHQISSDQVTWQAVTAVPELFRA